MKKYNKLWQCFYAVGLMAIAIQQLVCKDFRPVILPTAFPAWLQAARLTCTWIFSVLLIAACLSILLNIKARTVSLITAFILLLIEFFFSEKRKSKLKNAVALFFFMAFSVSSFAQSPKESIIKGNKSYKENNFDAAENEYRDALKKSDTNVTASYNLGNVLYRKDNTEEAVKSYDNAIANTKSNAIKQEAFYNKGVALQKAKKLPECITAYKNALILNPNDEDARQNLQRALKEQQQQQKQQQQNKNQNKNQNKDQNKNQNQNKQDQKKNNEPQPQPSKLTKQDAEEKLKSLLQNEKELQDKLHKIKGAPVPNSPEKDW